MKLAVPILIMLVVLASAWALGALARGRAAGVQKAIGATGIAALFGLTLVFDASAFQGTCHGSDGVAYACQLGDYLWQTFRNGLAFTIAPALMWLGIYAMSLNAPTSK